RHDSWLIADIRRSAFERQIVRYGLCERGVHEGLKRASARRAASQLLFSDAARFQIAANPAEEARIGTAEAVNGLLRITDHVQLARRGSRLLPVALRGILRGQKQQYFGLQRIGILKLVDKDAVIAPLQIAPRRIVAQQVASVEQQVHKIELAGRALLGLV